MDIGLKWMLTYGRQKTKDPKLLENDSIEDGMEMVLLDDQVPTSYSTDIGKHTLFYKNNFIRTRDSKLVQS